MATATMPVKLIDLLGILCDQVFSGIQTIHPTLKNEKSSHDRLPMFRAGINFTECYCCPSGRIDS